MLRTLASPALAALLVLTLFWGGCVSCPRFFMFPSSEKNCCKAGKCERQNHNSQSKRECKRMPLEQPGASHVPVEPAVTTTGDALVAPTISSPAIAAYWERLPREHSPPDRQALFSTFLI